jgi:hypothetical protein
MDINDQDVKVIKVEGQDYICLTDMAKSAGQERALFSWIRTKSTIGFLGLWEQMNNPDFKVHEFVYFKTNAGENSFNPSVIEWIEKTNSKGIISHRGRYGGTYAHRDIAFEFGTWLSPEFKLMLITEFQRLKENESRLVEWDSRRYLTRVNYRLHTDAIKQHIIPLLGTGAIHQYVYTTEADMLNRLVFGQTATEWKNMNPQLAVGQRNQRDYASSEQLVLLSNIESLNSHLIARQKTQSERIIILANEVKRQYGSLISAKEIIEKSTSSKRKLP